MNKFLKNFLTVGLKIAEIQVPAIATVEQAVKSVKAGGDKKDAVLEIVKNAPALIEAGLDKDIINDTLFQQGIGEINDGYVKVMKAIQNHSTEK